MSKIYKLEELMRGSGRNNVQYYIPELDKWVNNKWVYRYLKSIGLTGEWFYNRHVLGIDDPDYRPKCANPECSNLITGFSLHRGYNMYCGVSCQSKCNWNNPEFVAKQHANNPSYSNPQGLYGLMIQNEASYEKWKAHSPVFQPGGMHYYLLSHGYEGYINFMKMGGVFGYMYRNGINFNAAQQKYVTGTYESPKCDRVLYYRSSYELRYMKILDKDDNVESFEYERLFLDYEYKGKTHKYIVDFIVHYKDGTTKLKEVKPSYLIEDEIVKLKELAGRKYAAEHSMTYEFVTGDELKELEDELGISEDDNSDSLNVQNKIQ